MLSLESLQETIANTSDKYIASSVVMLALVTFELSRGYYTNKFYRNNRDKVQDKNERKI